MDPATIQKLVWLGLLLAFGVGEAISVGLTSVWFAVGALAALIVALFGGPLWLQIALFIVISLLCLAAVRPLAKRYLNNKVQPTNADRVIGAEAWVSEDIDNLHAKGAVTLNGIRWTARSADDSQIAAGTLVKVLRIEGVKVFVERVPVNAAPPASTEW